MKTSCAVTVFCLVPMLVCAADPELTRLQKSYAEAAERALAPVKDTYVRELEKLMAQHAKANNLEAALGVKAELERITGKAVSDPAIPKSTAEADIRKKLTRGRFAFFFAPPRSKTMTFGSDGKIEEGSAVQEFKWKLEGDELLIFNDKEELAHSLKYDPATDTFVKGPGPSLWMSRNVRMENAPKLK